MTIQELRRLVEGSTAPWTRCIDEVWEEADRSSIVGRDYDGNPVFENNDDARLVAFAPQLATELADAIFTIQWVAEHPDAPATIAGEARAFLERFERLAEPVFGSRR